MEFRIHLHNISPCLPWQLISDLPKINIILLPDQHSTTYRSHLIRAFSLESQREVGGCLFLKHEHKPRNIWRYVCLNECNTGFVTKHVLPMWRSSKSEDIRACFGLFTQPAQCVGISVLSISIIIHIHCRRLCSISQLLVNKKCKSCPVTDLLGRSLYVN